MKKQGSMTKKPALARLRIFALSSAVLLAALPLPVAAQDDFSAPPMPDVAAVVDILPVEMLSGDGQIPAESDSTHPTLHMTPDKSELVRLPRDAGTIVVGNPAHVNVIADSSRTLVVVPRLPGATYFTVLDKHGDILMQRHVIVASPRTNYVRVRRTCTDDAKGCRNTSVFYCPDMCHEILMGGEDDSGDGSASAAGSDAIDGAADAMDTGGASEATDE